MASPPVPVTVEDTSLTNDHHRAVSPAPSIDTEQSTAKTTTAASMRHMKRNREEAAMGPTTPRTEDETKNLGASTPLAKKGRVQGATSIGADEDGAGSDVDSQIDDNDEHATITTVPTLTSTNKLASQVTTQARTTPPPAGLDEDSTSAPPTPLQVGKEGRETRSIRRRVQALEWEDGQPQTDVPADDEDTEIAQVAAEVASSAELVETQDETNTTTQDDVEIATVADEVSATAARLDDQQEAKEEQDEAIADVAAEVATSAQAVDGANATTMSTSAAPSLPQPTASAAVPLSPPKTSFSAFSSTSSPFSAVKSAASPLAAVSTSEAALAPAKVSDHKQKARSSFGATAPATPAPAARSLASPSSESATAAPPQTPQHPAATMSAVPAWAKSSANTAPAPSTPLGKSTTSAFGAAGTSTPFSAFAGTSGFASASKGVGAAGSSSAFGSYSAGTASPFASVASKKDKDDAGEDTGRKIGEAEKPDPSKKQYKEQETVTGEEEDELLHSVRCKLFAMHEGSWVERGTGLLKLNATKDNDKKGARLVMRADATHRLLLNAPLFSKFSIQVSQDKYVRFVIIEGSEPISYMLRTSGPANAQNLVSAVQDRVASM